MLTAILPTYLDGSSSVEEIVQALFLAYQLSTEHLKAAQEMNLPRHAWAASEARLRRATDELTQRAVANPGRMAKVPGREWLEEYDRMYQRVPEVLQENPLDVHYYRHNVLASYMLYVRVLTTVPEKHQGYDEIVRRHAEDRMAIQKQYFPEQTQAIEAHRESWRKEQRQPRLENMKIVLKRRADNKPTTYIIDSSDSDPVAGLFYRIHPDGKPKAIELMAEGEMKERLIEPRRLH